MNQQVTSRPKPIPEKYHSVTPYIVAERIPILIDFLKRTFNAVEVERMTRPDGKISHAELKIGDSIVMLGEANEQAKPTPSMLYVYLEDVDSAYKRGLQAGGKSIREPKNEFYGDRNAAVADPVGNQWWIATHVEDVSAEELERRFKAQRS